MESPSRMPKKNKTKKPNKIELSQVKLCPECGSDNVYYSEMRDELICRDCGGIFSKLTPEQMEKYKDSLK
jgi:ribosomal protein S27E